MLFKILMFFSLTTMSCNSTDVDLLKKSNEAVIDIVGEEIFANHIKLDSSLIKFYKKDFTYDDLQNYNKSTEYEYASIKYSLYEDNEVIGRITADSNKDTVDIMNADGLMAFKIYFENPTLTRYSELKKIFKKLFPKEELYFSPYMCKKSIRGCDECSYLRIFDDLIWETKFYSPPLSYYEDGEYDYILYKVFIDAKNPYNHLITSHHRRTIVD